MLGVGATPAEVARPLPGDDVVPEADVVMDRGFTLDATPDEAWPWLVQLGKQRAGWYLPAPVERLVPAERRASRALLPEHASLEVGDVVPDYGGPHETFEVVSVDPPRSLVYRSQRGRGGRVAVSWAIVLAPYGERTRVQLRLRLGGLRRPWLAASLGEAFDLLTIAGMAAGLRERLREG
ncbi:hypothetical protein GCM10009623_20930 [Nocardioides aestuarii]|uniref:SRPBCC family protein n=1 Tax=Nocardioides aestuarii TaxID=252231 RepID=A0ABW4TNX5_9ACTN